MLALTNALIDSTLARLGYHRRANGELCLLGIRGAVPVDVDGQTIKTGGCGGTTNQYDDCIGVYGPTLHFLRASVDPGKYYTDHPLNPGGVAHLCNGSYVYRWGSHKGHLALVEAEPVTVWRDTNRNGLRDPGEAQEKSQALGVHIHSGGFTTVDEWSAGCQVIESRPPWGEPWQTFVKMLQVSGQRTFAYTLIDAEQLSG